jgi:hypothetical protein
VPWADSIAVIHSDCLMQQQDDVVWHDNVTGEASSSLIDLLVPIAHQLLQMEALYAEAPGWVTMVIACGGLVTASTRSGLAELWDR